MLFHIWAVDGPFCERTVIVNKRKHLRKAIKRLTILLQGEEEEEEKKKQQRNYNKIQTFAKIISQKKEQHFFVMRGREMENDPARCEL